MRRGCKDFEPEFTKSADSSRPDGIASRWRRMRVIPPGYSVDKGSPRLCRDCAEPRVGWETETLERDRAPLYGRLPA